MGGTKLQFFELYEITAKHLKKCFPDLKIGGPALAHQEDWADDFLCEMQKRSVPIDFFSWHIYATEPQYVIEKADKIKSLLIKYGYENAENILNEWNYVKGWSEEFLYTIKMIHGVKGAAFVMSVISEAQSSSIDMLMYYDTRPSVFNGAFDYYTYEKLKGYYPLMWYGKFYNMENEIRAENKIENIYSLCGVDRCGKVLCVITHYSDDDNTEEKEISVEFGRKGDFEVYLLDKEHDGEFIKTTDKLNFVMPIHSCVMIKEK